MHCPDLLDPLAFFIGKVTPHTKNTQNDDDTYNDGDTDGDGDYSEDTDEGDFGPFVSTTID